MKNRKNILRKTLSAVLTFALILSAAVGIIPTGITASAIPVPEYYLSVEKITAGSGTQSDPYLIATKEEFFSLTDVDLYSNYYGGIKYFKITEDIDFGGYYFDQSIIGSHYIDGNGKTLNNIYMLAGVSLFTSFNEIKNITLSNMTSTAPLVADDFRIGRIDFLTIANGHFVGFRLGGIIADRITNEFDDVSVTNCHIVNTTYDLSTNYIEDYFAGGLFGEVVIVSGNEYEITIKGNTISKSKLSIEAGAPISFGGIVGRIYTSSRYGVSDYTEGSKIYIPLEFSCNVIAQCEMWVYNPISGIHGDYKINNIGGIVGSIETSQFCYFTLKNCHNYGGVIYSDTVDEIWESNVIEHSQPGALGGIVGKIDMGNVTVSMCSNNTDLKDFSTIGGIVGIKRSGCELVIEQCYNRGDILLEKSISYTHILEDGEYLYYNCTSVPISVKTDFSCGFGGIIGACQTQTSIDKKTAIYDCVNFGNIKGYKDYNAIEIPMGGIVGSVEINALSYFEVERCYTTGKFTNTGSDERVDMHIGFTFDGYQDITLETDIYDAHSLSLHMLYYEDTTKPAGISADYGSAVTDDYIFTDLAEDYNYDIYATAWRIPFDGAASGSNYQTEIYPIPAALCNYATACPYDFADFGTGDPFYADDYFETGFGFATLGEAVLHTQSGYWSEQGYLNPYIFVQKSDFCFETVISTQNINLKNMSDATYTINKHIMFMGNGEKRFYADSNISYQNFGLYYTLTYRGGNIPNFGTPEGRMPEMIITNGSVQKDTYLLDNTYSAPGYSFEGWKVGSTVYQPGQPVSLPKGYYCREIVATWVSSQPIYVSVIIMGEATKTIEVYYGCPYPDMEKPECYGYTFLGYSTTENSSYCSAYNSNMVPRTCTITSAHNIYAVWDPNGDMDGDKVLSAPDLVLLRQVLLGGIDSNDEADVNLDDSINIKDLIRLKKYIAGG